jgi:hypothetical protein
LPAVLDQLQALAGAQAVDSEGGDERRHRTIAPL